MVGGGRVSWGRGRDDENERERAKSFLRKGDRATEYDNGGGMEGEMCSQISELVFFVVIVRDNNKR